MLVGKGISEGIGLGKAVILKENELKIEKQKIEDISAEKQRVYNAIKEVENEIENLIQNISGTETTLSIILERAISKLARISALPGCNNKARS